VSASAEASRKEFEFECASSRAQPRPAPRDLPGESSSGEYGESGRLWRISRRVTRSARGLSNCLSAKRDAV
jgi:hypothetical protein